MKVIKYQSLQITGIAQKNKCQNLNWVRQTQMYKSYIGEESLSMEVMCPYHISNPL